MYCFWQIWKKILTCGQKGNMDNVDVWVMCVNKKMLVK